MTEPDFEVTKESVDLSSDSLKEPQQSRYREIPKNWQFVMTVMTAVSIFLAINQIFNLGLFVGYVMLDLSLIHI